MMDRELFKRKMAEDRRLVILRFLEEEPDYRLNVSLLQDALETMGHNVSRDVVLADGHFLNDLGLLVIEGEAVVIFKLTACGAEVARGQRIVPGIKRPAPR